MSSFGRGFRNRNPLVLVVAAALLVPALLGFQAFFTSGAWSVIPLRYLLLKPTDSFTYVSWTVGSTKRHPPATKAVYITGGSASREAIVSGPSLAAEVKQLGGPTIQAYDFGSINQNFAESLAIADNVPARDAWVIVGINLGRFTPSQEDNTGQVQGRPFVLQSKALQSFVSHTWGTDKYSLTIIPGIFSYLTSLAKQNGKHWLSGKVPASEYVQHQYTTVDSRAAKNGMVKLWNTSRYPVFQKNLQLNLQMLQALLARCRARGLHVLVVELPSDNRLIRGRFTYAIRQYRGPAKKLAAQYGAQYVNFNARADIPNRDFHDLSHLVAPGRVIWQHQLARVLARAMSGTAAAGRAG